MFRNGLIEPNSVDMKEEDMLSKVWFSVIISSVVLAMVLVFVIIFFLTRRLLLSKESNFFGIYVGNKRSYLFGTIAHNGCLYLVTETRSNGAILGTPVSLKATVGLPHRMSTSLLPHLNGKKDDGSFWIDRTKNQNSVNGSW